jgi:integrase
LSPERSVGRGLARSGPPATTHDLRHSYASLARAAGADLRFVHRTLGHSSPVVTTNISSDLYDSELNTVATNLDRMHENSAFPTGQEPDTNKNP